MENKFFITIYMCDKMRTNMKIQTRERVKKNEPNKVYKMTFRLEQKLKDRYINFCKENGYSYGKRLRVLLINDLNK